jgi:hypothetical protein
MMATLGAAFDIKDMGALTVADGWVRLSHAYLRLICIDDSRCPAFLCIELSPAMAPCFAMMMKPNSPQKLLFSQTS